MRYILLTILFCLTAAGQEAYVVQLSVPDATQARETWDQLQTAKKNWEAVQKAMALKYLVVDPSDPEASDKHYVGEGLTGTANSGTLTTYLSLGSIVNLPLSAQEAARLAKEEDKRVEQWKREKRQRRGFESCCENTLPQFQFTRDFRFIVPEKVEVKTTPGSYLIPAAH